MKHLHFDMATTVELHLNDGAKPHLAIKEALAFANLHHVTVDAYIDRTLIIITEDSEIDDLLEEFEDFNTL